ncbi:hypothetical protein [Anaerococcus sp. Marseille-P3625]|uniref:hypothetical protein n=1 Tax=Anaerococcus sp. Marseille-P3625 TaxID=1977277 RepID=UPI000C08A046|nr:hypothetical protein [Anaerococcus sp. Marseille-P3625]
MNKNEYLKQEKTQLEQSKERIVDNIGVDYMAGYRDGYDLAYSNIIGYLKCLDFMVEVAKATREAYELLNTTDLISTNMSTVNKESLNLHDLKIYNNNVFDLKATNLKLMQNLDRLGKIGASLEYLNGTRELDNSINFNVSINEVADMIKQYKYTDDEIDVILKCIKSEADYYIELGKEIAEELDANVNDDYYKIDKTQRQKFIEKQLLTLYKNRNNLHNCIGA